jgi:Tfp pilus assembly protein PilN
MGAIGVTFSVIKMRQKAVSSELQAIESKMAGAQLQIAQLEEIKTKSKKVMGAMVMTAELLEPMPRSLILASLTNNLPSGVSLLELRLNETELKTNTHAPKTGQYQKNTQKPVSTNQKPATETSIEITGIAPSDIEVAGYIAKLSSSILTETVELVQSKEHKADNSKYREFKLKVKLKSNISLSREDIEIIKNPVKGNT